MCCSYTFEVDLSRCDFSNWRNMKQNKSEKVADSRNSRSMKSMKGLPKQGDDSQSRGLQNINRAIDRQTHIHRDTRCLHMGSSNSNSS